jgi:hypothetical protein
MKNYALILFCLVLHSCSENKSEVEKISKSINENIINARELQKSKYNIDTSSADNKFQKNQKEKEELEYLQKVMENSTDKTVRQKIK